MDLRMSESSRIDSPSRGRTMPRAYSSDLRESAIVLVDMEGASRHEAAELLGVSVASAVRWVQRWHETRSVEAKPHGGSVSPLEEVAAEILAVIAEKPDLTLEETAAELRRRIRTSRSALSRFFARHDISLKKKPAGGRTGAGRRGPRASTLDPRARHA